MQQEKMLILYMKEVAKRRITGTADVTKVFPDIESNGPCAVEEQNEARND